MAVADLADAGGIGKVGLRPIGRQRAVAADVRDRSLHLGLERKRQLIGCDEALGVIEPDADVGYRAGAPLAIPTDARAMVSNHVLIENGNYYQFLDEVELF